MYKEIVESYRLPDCQEALSRTELEIPHGEDLVRELTKHSGFEKHQKIDPSNLWLPDGSTVEGIKKMFLQYKDVFQPWMDLRENRVKSKDFNCLVGLIEEFIKVGFNKESEQVRKKFKVTAYGSPCLFFAICFRTLGESCNVTLKEWEKVKILRFGRKTFDLLDIADAGTVRLHRYLSNQKKRAGYLMVHEKIIDRATWRWYQCRVKCSGIHEFCEKEGLIIDDYDVSKEIAYCDDIMGYPRGNRRDLGG